MGYSTVHRFGSRHNFDVGSYLKKCLVDWNSACKEYYSMR